MVRTVIALVAVVVLLAAGAAAAERLSVSAGSLQTGADEKLTCNQDGVSVVWEDVDADGAVEAARVTGIDRGDGACDGSTLQVLAYSDPSCLAGLIAIGQTTIAGSMAEIRLSDPVTASELIVARCVRVQILNGRA